MPMKDSPDYVNCKQPGVRGVLTIPNLAFHLNNSGSPWVCESE